MILNILKKPFAILCILLTTSGYVSALGFHVDKPKQQTDFMLDEHALHLEIKSSIYNQDDVDLKDKDFIEEDTPARKGAEQRMRLY
jgi:hypothetical protein